MDSLFIARRSDILIGVGVRFPFDINIGAEELKIASSRNWGGNSSGFGIRHKNLDGGLVSEVSHKISSRPSILT
jgi:hypothetical protein